MADNGSDLPTTIGAPARRALLAAGYTRLEQLAALREADMLRLHGVGPKAVRLLRQALAERGLAFADAPGEPRAPTT
jgi:predicted flap endonuclease-1-like 5' DNA nuclease